MPYIIVDKTPDKRATKVVREQYHPIMAAIIEQRQIVGGDALVLRDWLLEHGFEWGRDFYIKKVEEPNQV